MSDAMKAAADSIDSCIERCRSVQADHAATAKVHDTLSTFHSQLTDAATAGDLGKARSLCDSLGTALREAKRSHNEVAKGHDGLQRGLDTAKLAVEGARSEAGSDSWSDPTVDEAVNAAAGMTTAGPSGNGNPPRSYSRADIEARDRRQAVISTYRQKIEEMRRRH